MVFDREQQSGSIEPVDVLIRKPASRVQDLDPPQIYKSG
eukprot:CAMPEP_0184747844 /NCGR_PEP_ID=MMETSP0315-20130426/14091_1 /TAXON_ID=101924 /ORGANISM="Rhodosorus marinus, Strain UTEX LB 2760" /LENGTH=38 /DNA_ID= /DNA_START= /DNA_END= /DNA_ORIENTATION=